MNIEHLECFIAVVESGSFRKASDRLNKVQSAVSNSVKSLEEHIGFDLFDRSTYRPTPTKKGNLFYSYAKSFLSSEAQLEKIALNLKEQDVCLLRIAIDPVIDLNEILPSIKKIKDEFPAVQIQLQAVTLSGPIELLKNDQVDIAITGIFDGGLDYEYKPAIEISFVAVASPSLISNYKTIRPEELDGFTQVMVSDISSHASEDLGFMKTSPKWTVTDFPAKKEILVNGLGWGNMPHHMVKKEIGEKKLFVINGLRKSKFYSHVIKKNKPADHPVIDFAFSVF